jgi:hypothetical protein
MKLRFISSGNRKKLERGFVEQAAIGREFFEKVMESE